MGFNIEEYEIGSDNYNNSYSNASGYLCELIINKNKKAECEKVRDARKAGGTKDASADAALSKGAVCVKGLPVYHPYAYAITGQAKRTQNRMICKARKEAKVKDDVVPADAVKDNPLADAQAPTGTGTDAGSASSSTGMYVGIGVGILAIGIVAIVLIKRRK
jgi:hypothetical protein